METPRGPNAGENTDQPHVSILARIQRAGPSRAVLCGTRRTPSGLTVLPTPSDPDLPRPPLKSIAYSVEGGVTWPASKTNCSSILFSVSPYSSRLYVLMRASFVSISKNLTRRTYSW